MNNTTIIQHETQASYDHQTFVPTVNRDLYFQTHHLIDLCFKMRFIERIASPIPMQKKLIIINKYSACFEAIHERLTKIKNHCIQLKPVNSYTSLKSKKNKIGDTLTQHLTISSENLHKIEKKYYQVFYQGNFKNYKKIAQLLNIDKQMPLIDIAQWRKVCYAGQNKKQGCC